MYVYNKCAYICICTYIHVYIYIYVYTYASTHTRARRHTDRVGELSGAAPAEATHECPLVLALLPQVLSDLCVCACVREKRRKRERRKENSTKRERVCVRGERGEGLGGEREGDSLCVRVGEGRGEREVRGEEGR